MDSSFTAGSTIAARSIALALALTALFAGHPVLAEDGACKPVFAAITRLVTTPNHQYMTQTSGAPGDAARASETISTGKITYMLRDGQWQVSPMTPQETLKLDAENRKNSKTSCHLVREESVDGVAAKMFAIHSETQFGKSDGQIWISKASALPLRQQIDLQINGNAGKPHMETRFVYTGVQAPI